LFLKRTQDLQFQECHKRSQIAQNHLQVFSKLNDWRFAKRNCATFNRENWQFYETVSEATFVVCQVEVDGLWCNLIWQNVYCTGEHPNCSYSFVQHFMNFHITSLIYVFENLTVHSMLRVDFAPLNITLL
jgi:hypothetical protein